MSDCAAKMMQACTSIAHIRLEAENSRLDKQVGRAVGGRHPQRHPLI